VRAGKSQKVALIACMRKLLTTLYAMMRTNTTWLQSAEATDAHAIVRPESTGGSIEAVADRMRPRTQRVQQQHTRKH